MSREWLLALHVFGVFMWIGSLHGVVHVLGAHADAELGARPAFHKIERQLGRVLDIGGTIAIVFALLLIRQSPIVMRQGWLHAKLAVVVLILLTLHVVAKIKIRKYREGKVVALPGFVGPLLSLGTLAIIIFAVARPF